MEYEGLPPLEPKSRRHVVFTGVKSMYTKEAVRGADGTEEYTIMERFDEEDPLMYNSVFVRDGSIECIQPGMGCLHMGQQYTADVEVVDLAGGSLAPGITTFGGPGLGLREINMEASTGDGVVFDALRNGVPSIVGGNEAIIKAKDGLMFGTRSAL